MFCAKCGKKLSGNKNFCTQCGANFKPSQIKQRDEERKTSHLTTDVSDKNINRVEVLNTEPWYYSEAVVKISSFFMIQAGLHQAWKERRWTPRVRNFVCLFIVLAFSVGIYVGMKEVVGSRNNKTISVSSSNDIINSEPVMKHENDSTSAISISPTFVIVPLGILSTGAVIFLLFRTIKHRQALNKRINERYKLFNSDFTAKGKIGNFIINKDKRFDFLVEDGVIVACRDRKRFKEFIYYDRGITA